MRTVVVTSAVPDRSSSGYDIRVAHLTAALPGERHLVVTSILDRPEGGVVTPELLGVFDSVMVLPPVLGGPLSLRRHLRRSDEQFLELAAPDRFAASAGALAARACEVDATHVVAFGGNVAPFAAAAGLGPRTVVDVCDSVTLTLSRAGARSAGERLALLRARREEAALVRGFPAVTAIGAPDAEQLRALVGGTADHVTVVPNGVGEVFTGPLPVPGDRRGVAFWGNLDFAPNRTALQFYLDDVHDPFLRDAGVELFVVGSGAPEWLTARAARPGSGIRLAGRVEDLVEAVVPYPVMVNPMRTGSGLKNKVLEAFGAGLVVVSTPRGVDAFPEVRERDHLITASDGPAFATAVTSLLDDAALRAHIRLSANALLHENYRWDSVGRNWAEVVLRHSGAAAENGK
ncbi:glycosyltransferase [Pseudonocardia sp. N23]|uniref:glycosyltransferase n=1 Tax=Pseudonocardia sp. N23 TaxID=1987376 RepID=UPI001145733D|nr:glycosyltransferase [Pseudonocardia sp. N23]